jgi:hypothetical protein
LKASKEVRVEVYAEKTKYMLMSRYQNAGQNYNIKISGGFFEKVAKFKYLGTRVTSQNLIHEEIKSRSNSGNVSVQNVLSSGLLSKYVKIKI